MRKVICCLNRNPGKHISDSLFGFKRTLMSSQGFTLTELVTVIAILGILLAISTPKMLTTISKYQVNTSIRKAFSDIQSAKLRAIQNNNVWAFEAEGTGKYCIKKQVAPPNWSNGCSTTTDTVTTIVDLENDYRNLTPTYMTCSDDLSVSSCNPAGTPFRIAFSPNGTCSGLNGFYSVNFCKGGIGRRILVNQFTGYMKIDSNPVPCP